MAIPVVVAGLGKAAMWGYGLWKAGGWAIDKAKGAALTYTAGRIGAGKDFWPLIVDLSKDLLTGNMTEDKAKSIMKLITGTIPDKDLNKAFKGIADSLSMLGKDPGAAIKGFMQAIFELIMCIRDYFSKVSSESRIILDEADHSPEAMKKQAAAQDENKRFHGEFDYTSDVALDMALTKQQKRNKQMESSLKSLQDISEFSKTHENVKAEIKRDGGIAWYNYKLELSSGDEKISVSLKDIKELVENCQEHVIFDLDKVAGIEVWNSIEGPCKDVETLRNEASETNKATESLLKKTADIMKEADRRGLTDLLNKGEAEYQKAFESKDRDVEFIKLKRAITTKWGRVLQSELLKHKKELESPAVNEGLNTAVRAVVRQRLGIGQSNELSEGKDQTRAPKETAQKRLLTSFDNRTSYLG